MKDHFNWCCGIGYTLKFDGFHNKSVGFILLWNSLLITLFRLPTIATASEDSEDSALLLRVVTGMLGTYKMHPI